MQYDFDDFVDATAMEYFSPVRFFKDHCTYRVSDLNGRIVRITPKLQLPWNSVLHVLDNMSPDRQAISDVPDLENNIFVQHEQSRKYIYHMRAPLVDETQPIHIDDKYIYRDSKLNTNLMKFRQLFGNRYRFVMNLETLPKPANTLTIINHNPLFRVIVRGILQDYRRFSIILASVMNTAAQIHGKTQYIHIPLSPRVFPREVFIRAQTKLDPTSLRYPRNFHYLFMVQWLNFLNTTTDLSLFERYPEEKLAETNFILQIKDCCLIFSMADMLRLNDNNRNFRKIVNQINTLALAAIGETVPVLTESTAPEGLPEDVANTTVPEAAEPTSPTPEDSAQSEEEPAQPVADDKTEEEIERLYQELTKLDVKEFDYEVPDHPDVTLPDELVEEPKTPVVSRAHPTNSAVAYLAPEHTISEESEDHSNETELSKTSIDPATIPAYEAPILKTPTPHKTVEDTRKQGQRHIKELEEAAHRVIDSHPTLTAKQRERLKGVAQLWKKIEIGGKPLEAHIGDGVDPEVSKEDLSFLNEHLVDTSMSKSSVIKLDEDYLQKYYHRDFAAVVTTFHQQGMFLVDAEEKIHSDQMNRTVTYKLTYEHVDGKRHTMKFSVPHIDKNGCCYVNGVKSYLKKQMVERPICKVSESKVSLTSNYNKTLVTRSQTKAHSFIFYLQRFLESINEEKRRIWIEYGALSLNQPVSYEYTTIARRYKSFRMQLSEKKEIFWTFDYHHRLPANQAELEELEQKHGLYVGRASGPMATREQWGILELHFLNAKNILTVLDAQTKEVLTRTTILDLLASVYPESAPSSRLTEWANINILDKQLPVGFLLAYRFGLKTMLDYMKVKYRIDPVRTRVARRATDVVLTFKDVTITIPRYPLSHSLVFAGLLFFNLKNYDLEDMNGKNAYFNLLLDKGYSTNYLKGIDSTFDLFIDFPTKDALEQMNEPTNFRDLLIRATEMISTDHHLEAAAMANHRMRSYERINAVLYNEMARQYAAFQHKSGRGNTFSINPQAVMQRILQDSAMVAMEDINPIHDIKTKSGITYVGVGGRSAEAFVIDNRKFPQDGVGILSEATADSGQVAINAIATMDPRVSGVRGLFDPQEDDLRKLQPTQVLSVTSLLMPGATNDDGKRANFINIQLSHQVPTKHSEVSRVRTGYERVIAHRSSDLYAYPAPKAGQVLELNAKLGLMKVKYSDGETATIQYGEEYSQCSDMWITQRIEAAVKEGDKFRKGAILCYNKEYFHKDPYSDQVDWKHGCHANVAIIDVNTTYEDSSTISKELGRKLEFSPVQTRTITLVKNTFVHEIVKVGQAVNINDPLLVFEDADMGDYSTVDENDAATLALLAKLNRTTPKAKFTGTIVRVEAYYSCPVGDMHPTLAKAVREAVKLRTERNKYSQGSASQNDHPMPAPLPSGTKFRGVRFGEDTVVLQFFIQEQIDAGIGDKLVLDSSLKSVIASVMSDPPVTQEGVQVDALFSGTSISNRIVLSPFVVGLTERVMERLEKDVLEEYFKG